MHARYHIKITTGALQKEVSSTALRTIIDANLGQDSLLGLIFHPKYHYDNNLFSEGNSYLEDQRRSAVTALKDSNVYSAWKAFGRLTHAVQDFYAHSNYVSLWLKKSVSQNPVPPNVGQEGFLPNVEHDTFLSNVEQDAFLFTARQNASLSNVEQDAFLFTARQNAFLSTVEQDAFLFNQIDPLDPALLNNPALRSGRIYYLLEAINYLPAFSGLAVRLSPKDSHLRMNLDSPDRGPLFPLALSAAQKRTLHEFKELSTIIKIELGPDALARFTDS